jgi:hypothetical protein
MGRHEIAFSLLVAVSLAMAACTEQTSTGTPGASAVVSREDITALARTELPRAATAIKLSRTNEGRQSCMLAFDDKTTSKTAFFRGQEKPTYDLTVHWDRGYSMWKFDGDSKVSSLEDLRTVIKKCVLDGVVVDRYHSPRFEHDD